VHRSGILYTSLQFWLALSLSLSFVEAKGSNVMWALTLGFLTKKAIYQGSLFPPSFQQYSGKITEL